MININNFIKWLDNEIENARQLNCSNPIVSKELLVRVKKQLEIETLKQAHDKSSYHRKEIEVSAICYCFYCLNNFPPVEIKEWIDKNQTALCPRCGIDSVLGDASLEITQEFLKEMNEYWFKRYEN